jgi:hypothetical protein
MAHELRNVNNTIKFVINMFIKLLFYSITLIITIEVIFQNSEHIR